MRIVLLGANGQLGFELKRAFAPLGEVMALDRDKADLLDAERLAATLLTLAPELILNAAAYTAVDRAESEPEQADRINHLAVAAIGRAAQTLGARVVHYSTDYVFAGAERRPCREDAPLGPHSVYGLSKLRGEIALRESGAQHLILRTAWVYAARGGNFLRTMLKLGRERDELKVVNDQTGSPTPARWLAGATALAVMRWQDCLAPANLSGTYHLSAAGDTTWYAFACEIFARAKRQGLITQTPRVLPISSAAFAAKAVRPAYSVLDSDHFNRTFNLKLPHWGVGLDEVLAELQA